MPVFDVTQPPQGRDQALPAHPVVSSGATQTNANTGGMVDRGAIGQYLPQGNLVEVGWPQPQNVFPASLGRAAAETGRLVGAGVSAYMNTPQQQAATDGLKHAAATAMAYLTGHAEGASKAPPPAPTPTPPHTPTPGYQVQYPNALGGRPDARGNFPGYNGDGVSITPGPVGYVGPAPGGQAPAAPSGGNMLTAAAGAMPRDQFVNAFRGVPAQMLIEALQVARPPSMEDQARSLSVDAAAHSGGRDLVTELLRAFGLGGNYVPFAGMNKAQ